MQIEDLQKNNSSLKAKQNISKNFQPASVVKLQQIKAR